MARIYAHRDEFLKGFRNILTLRGLYKSNQVLNILYTIGKLMIFSLPLFSLFFDGQSM